MNKCKLCGAPIKWIPMRSGRNAPCNAEQVVYWKKNGAKDKIVTPNGEVISAELHGDPQKATGVGYISHFATCPGADQFRRREKSNAADDAGRGDAQGGAGQES